MKRQNAIAELFPAHSQVPEGFYFIADFLSRDEENTILNYISQLDLHPFVFQGFEAKRKVISFGYDYSFDKRSLTKGKPIPAELEWLLQKTRPYIIVDNSIAELLITEYPPGAVINWHRDAPPFDVIAGISLSTDCTFRLRPLDKAKQNRKSIIYVPLPSRSLYVMQGEVRESWQHSVMPGSATRYSITLRTLKSYQSPLR